MEIGGQENRLMKRRQAEEGKEDDKRREIETNGGRSRRRAKSLGTGRGNQGKWARPEEKQGKDSRMEGGERKEMLRGPDYAKTLWEE